MSLAASDIDDFDSYAAAAAAGAPQPKLRYKRCKIAIFLAYCGVGYHGMQKSHDVHTIKGDLEEALFLTGAVPAADRAPFPSSPFLSAATDDSNMNNKGVGVRVIPASTSPAQPQSHRDHRGEKEERNRKIASQKAISVILRREATKAIIEKKRNPTNSKKLRTVLEALHERIAAPSLGISSQGV